MSNRRAKYAAVATIAALGALGGVALETNHGVPAATRQLASGSAPIVTSASGAVSAPAMQPSTVAAGKRTSPPIVTRSSGSGARTTIDD